MASTSSNIFSHNNCKIEQDFVDTEITKQLYYEKLVEYDNQHSGSSRRPWTQERIAEVISDLKNIMVTTKKKTVDYYWKGKYEVVTTATDEFLTFKKRSPEEPVLRIAARETYFDILSEVHKSCGHGGRDKMVLEIKSKYYIPKKAIEIFVSVCPVCESKRGGQKYDTTPRTIISRHLNEEGYLDLIDLQSSSDGEYNWILHYQNLSNKFTILRPLKTTNTREVAYELLSIFLTLGAPHTLQSNLTCDFMTSVLEEFATMWSDCKIVHKTEENIENISDEVVSMLRSWMYENNSTNWSIGCLFVQYQKNTTFHRAVGKFPYEALFGRISKSGKNMCSVSTSSLSTNEQFSNVTEQEDLNIKVEVKVEDDSPDFINTETDETLEQKFTLEDSENTDAYKCQSCNSTVHIVCGVTENEEGQNIKVCCYFCKSKQEMVLSNNKATKRAIEDTIDDIPKKIITLEIGHSVVVAVPKAYRGPLKTMHITGKIVDIRFGVYRVATQIGTIKNWISRHDLQPMETDYGTVSKIPVTFEEAVASQPNTDRLQFLKCHCKPAVNQCHNNRCICYKNKTSCGSNCHQSLTCVNS